jgi:23S rRNA (adenine2503-C2)-methyltransferase
MKQDIKSMNREPLTDWLAGHQVRSFRSDQILKWVYMRLADSFGQMSDISKNLRSLLDHHFSIARLPVQKIQTASDGTRKYLFSLADGHGIETVLIPERNHYTLCVSSQVGCAQGCQFCVTGQAGLVRNLTAAEIISQVWEVRKLLPDPERLTNLVFMGMGEPLANYHNLVAAIEALTSTQWGMKIANRRVTVSTAGLVPRMADLGRDTKINLAVSLNAVDDETRNRLMPINRKYPIQALLEACRQYPLPKGRRITVEYILFKDVNDSVDQARKLARLLAPVKAKINLIPFNPYPGSPFGRPGDRTIQAFQEVLIGKHLTSVVRYSKGQDIMAACGQLRAGKS